MHRRTFLALPFAAGLAAAESEAGFTPLFDGRTLDGWTVREGPESAFYVNDGSIVVHQGSNFPTWLRSARQYENFDFRCEFYVKGWCNSGIYLHAPEHGRNTWCGMKVNIFQKKDDPPLGESMGSIFPLVPPKLVNVKNQGEWNSMRVVMDWPSLRVWVNDEQVQDVNVETVADLRYRLRSGYLGLESLSYPIRFRNLRIKELPSKVKYDTLYESAADAGKWKIQEGKATWEYLGGVIRADGLGYLATKENYKDFELQMYVRGSKHHNGGIIFRSTGEQASTPHYEIQLHDVEGAVYPTGSLYGYQRASYPQIAPEEWYLLQLFVQGPRCVVRINGENVVDYSKMTNNSSSGIWIQAHENNKWIEYKQIRVRRLA